MAHKQKANASNKKSGREPAFSLNHSKSKHKKDAFGYGDEEQKSFSYSDHYKPTISESKMMMPDSMARELRERKDESETRNLFKEKAKKFLQMSKSNGGYTFMSYQIEGTGDLEFHIVETDYRMEKLAPDNTISKMHSNGKAMIPINPSTYRKKIDQLCDLLLGGGEPDSSSAMQDVPTREERFNRPDRFLYKREFDDASLYRFEDEGPIFGDKFEIFQRAIEIALKKAWSFLNEPCRKALEKKGYWRLIPFVATIHNNREDSKDYEYRVVPVEMECKIVDDKGKLLCRVQINIDKPSLKDRGPLHPHIGYEVKYVVGAGPEIEFTKEKNKYSGHIFLNEVPTGRPGRPGQSFEEPILLGGKLHEPKELLEIDFFRAL